MFGLYNSVERICNPNKPVFYCDLHRILETSHLNTPYFFIKIHLLFPEKLRKTFKKMPSLAMLKKVR